MKFGIVKINPHDFTIPALPKNIFLDGKIFTTIFKYPTSENPKRNNLRIDWKYRISYNNEHVFSYICETTFIIEDDGISLIEPQLDKFIKDIYLNVEIGWEDRTRTTRLAGTTMPNIEGENLTQVRKQIIDYLD